MREPIISIVACALVAAVAIFAGASQLRYPSLVAGEAATTGSAMSSTEMTIKDDRQLPVEQWDAH
jgi:hypothetical protein